MFINSVGNIVDDIGCRHGSAQNAALMPTKKFLESLVDFNCPLWMSELKCFRSEK